MIFITGDTHGQMDTGKLLPGAFPAGESLTRDDFLIVAGDFGAVWDGAEHDKKCLEFWNGRKYTVLFIDGNHENFDLLTQYQEERWKGGKVHRISENVIHLMRGQVYEIDRKTFFTFGGGISIDRSLRLPHISWWPQESPSAIEIDAALDNLERYGNKVDYIVTHAAPQSIMRNDLCRMKRMLKVDCPTEEFLDYLLNDVKIEYGMWFCGHYHLDAWIRKCNLQALYNTIVKIPDGCPA